MGASLSTLGCTTSDSRYIHESWLTDNKKGRVKVWSRRISAFLGVHHFIVIDNIGDGKWRVFEWGNGGSNGWNQFSAYACSTIKGQCCISDLGIHSIKDVYQAAKDSSYGACYGTNYNCNEWTENVARKLGRNIQVHWNCSCVM